MLKIQWLVDETVSRSLQEADSVFPQETMVQHSPIQGYRWLYRTHVLWIRRTDWNYIYKDLISGETHIRQFWVVLNFGETLTDPKPRCSLPHFLNWPIFSFFPGILLKYRFFRSHPKDYNWSRLGPRNLNFHKPWSMWWPLKPGDPSSLWTGISGKWTYCLRGLCEN